MADAGRSWPALEIAGPALPSLSDRLLALLDDWSPSAIDEIDEQTWRVFFADPPARDSAVTALLPAVSDAGVTVTALDVSDERWAERSQASLRAIQVGTITVAPPWDISTTAAPGNITIVIQPSMGFGTGHHASTRLCLHALQQLPLAGTSVLDVGTGSGVLAIAASRLGANRVIGIDFDPDAIESALENLVLNRTPTINIRVADVRDVSLPAADVVVANLTGALLCRYPGDLLTRTLPGGRLVLSGFTDVEEPAVIAAFAPRARVVGREQEDEWVCLTLSAFPF